MPDQNLSISIRADASQLRADLAVAQAQLRELGTQLRAAAADSAKTGDTTAVRGLADAFEQTRGKVTSLRGELAALGGGREGGGLEAAMAPLVGQARELGGIFGVLGPLVEGMTSGFGGLATAVGLAAAALFEFSKHAAESTRQIENTAADLGLSAEKYEQLKFAFTRAGASAEGFDRSMERLNASIAKGAEEQRKNQAETIKAADTAERNRIEVEKLELGQKKLQDAVEASATSITKAKDAYAASTVTAQKAGDTLREYQNTARAAADAASGVGSSVHKLAEEQITAAKAVSDSKLAYQNISTSVTAYARAQEAARIGAEELRLKQKEAGEEVYKAKNGWEQLGISLLDAQGKTRELKDVFPEVVDGLAKVTNAAERAKILREFIGKGFAEMLPGLRQGNAEIERLGKLLEHSGALATEAEKHMAEEFNSSFATFTALTEGLGRAIGNIFGELFTGAFNKLSNAMMENAGNIREVAHTLVETLGFALKGVGIGFDALMRVIKDLNAIFGEHIGKLGVVVGLFLALQTRIGLMIAIVVAIDRALTAAFGDEATARIVSWGIEVVAAVKVLGLLLNAFFAINAAAAPWIALGAAIAAVGVLILALFGPIEDVKKFIGKVFGEDAAELFGKFAELVNHAAEALGEAFNAALKKVVSYFDPVFAKLGEIRDFIQSILNLAGSVAGAIGRAAGAAAGADQGAAPGLAAGGDVRGPGGRDRVPVWATAGEFIHQVAAVRYYGIDFMRRLNRMQIPRFEVGGFIDAAFNPVSHFADGGAVSAVSGAGANHIVNLTIGRETFRMTTDRETAGRVIRFAAGESQRSLGRLPTSMGGGKL